MKCVNIYAITIQLLKWLKSRLNVEAPVGGPDPESIRDAEQSGCP